MDNFYLMVILRLLHIVCAIFWGGAILYLAMFIMPTVNALGPDGGKFMQQLSKTNKFPLVMTLLGLTTILTGILMLIIYAMKIGSGLFSTGYGMAMTTGGTMALIAFLMGVLINKPAVDRMGKIGEEIAKAGGPPAPAQMQEIALLRSRLSMSIKIMAVLILGAIISMASMRLFIP